ncbi:luciferase family oxidoreductase, group 1 [Chitinophaga costaii]|uniref:Luciferase-like monooxygenase n=1 Tax=Chitinophaga costaii TaxID=1335309 RepID=A0A1C3ZME1_9BACT|nr:LLM class flavin-dependent oxidoreductase [Chitinophaga costaii]PUZ30433.1 LLM class flavin-dependent oxidoreductase [Chitinophaga costaii]SCB83503.1 luciferase family oxidoreductase, group 1 [Chitinophaga costaii]
MNNRSLSQVKYSILDLATVTEGHTAADSFHSSLLLAKQAETLGYSRYWFAEHHNMASVASSATSLLIGYIAGNTQTIRVGSGGIMLPNHAPLIVAEQFGTLASLYPGRIDLGLGRAPGSDQLTSRAIRGLNMQAAYHFPDDVQQLQTFFSASNSHAALRAIPGEGLDIPIWILGSSTDSARLAAKMGLPYAFASHFAPAEFMRAIKIYRDNFQPSAQLKVPYVLACVNVVMADTDAEALRLATSQQQMFAGIVTGQRQPLQPPVNDMSSIWNDMIEASVNQMLQYAFFGGVDSVRKKLEAFLAASGVDEIMATSYIYDQEARRYSCQLFAGLFQ